VAEDIVVPPSKLVDMVQKIQELSKKYSIEIAMVGHSGDGNLHPHFALDLRNEDERRRYKLAEKEMLEYAVALGGAITGEHGVGVVKKEHLSLSSAASNLKFMRMIKQVFDPQNIFNPEKVL